MDPRTRPDGLTDADLALLSSLETQPDDLNAQLDLQGVAEAVGAGRALLESMSRAGLLLPHHVDEAGEARYSDADVAAVRAGLEILESGLPLSEFLALAAPTDAAVAEIAERAVEAFLRFVRDPALGTTETEEAAGERLVAAYQRMLPATERLVAHQLRRHMLMVALDRLADGTNDRTVEG